MLPSLCCLNCEGRLDAETERDLRRMIYFHATICLGSLAFVRAPVPTPAPPA